MRNDRFTSNPNDFVILGYEFPGNVAIKPATDSNFKYEAFRTDVSKTLPVAWIDQDGNGFEVHTAVSIEHYPTLEAAAKAIAEYK